MRSFWAVGVLIFLGLAASAQTPVQPDLVQLICHQPSDLELLQKIITTPGFDLNAKISLGRTPLMLAASYPCENAAAVKILLDAGANPNLKSDYESANALLLLSSKSVLMREPLEIATLLLTAHTEINGTDTDGHTNLFYLIANYGDADATKDQRQTDQKMLELFLANHADVNAVDQNGNSPIMQMAWYLDPSTQSNLFSDEFLNTLLHAGSNLELRNNDGETPLLLTSRLYQPWALSFLQAGANPNVTDNDGNTPLMTAADYLQKDSKALAQALLKAGAKIDAQTADGVQAIHVAASSAVLNASVHPDEADLGFDFLDYLIQAGADVNAIENSGLSVLEFGLGDQLDSKNFYASKEQNRLLKLLFQSKLNFDQPLKKSGKTFLMLAVQTVENTYYDPGYSTHAEYADEIADLKKYIFEAIHRGARLDLTDAVGYTAVDYATRHVWDRDLQLLKP